VPSDLKNTLGSLLRTTLEHAGALKDAALREAKSTRSWLDAALAERRRKDLLAQLGQITHDLAARGELGDLEEFPEIADVIAAIDELDEQLTASGVEPGAPTAPVGPEAAEKKAVPVWRPVMPEEFERTGKTDTSVAFGADDAARAEEDADLADYMHEDDVPKR
jgi:hypothetical protein